MDNIGAYGEKLAQEYLLAKGYHILECNFKVFVGEIDLIATIEEYLVFVEVKTRKNDHYGAPGDFVTPSKQRKIQRAAEAYLEISDLALQPRFDVIEIYCDSGDIEHIEDAF